MATEDKYTELYEKAMAATNQDEWSRHEVFCAASSGGDTWLEYEEPNAAFMDAAKPKVVAGLIDELRRFRSLAAGWMECYCSPEGNKRRGGKCGYHKLWDHVEAGGDPDEEDKQ